MLSKVSTFIRKCEHDFGNPEQHTHAFSCSDTPIEEIDSIPTEEIDAIFSISEERTCSECGLEQDRLTVSYGYTAVGKEIHNIFRVDFENSFGTLDSDFEYTLFEHPEVPDEVYELTEEWFEWWSELNRSTFRTP